MIFYSLTEIDHLLEAFEAEAVRTEREMDEGGEVTSITCSDAPGTHNYSIITSDCTCTVYHVESVRVYYCCSSKNC